MNMNQCENVKTEKQNEQCKQYKNLLFDWDGTICDSADSILEAVRYAAERLGLPEKPYDVLKTFVGPPLTDSFISVYGLTPPAIAEGIKLFREKYTSETLLHVELYAGILDTLRMLKKSFRLFIATSKPEPQVLRLTAHFGIAELFDDICGSYSDTVRTSKSDVIEYLVEKNHLDAHECLMIGDKSHDTMGAWKCGIDSAGILWGCGSREEFESGHAAYIVEDQEELLRLLRTQGDTCADATFENLAEEPLENLAEEFPETLVEELSEKTAETAYKPVPEGGSARNTESENESTRNTEAESTRNTESEAVQITEAESARNTESEAVRNTKNVKILYHSDRIEKLRYIAGKSDWIDLRAAERVELKAGESALIDLGVSMRLPEGYEAHIAPRGSTFRTWGLLQTNSIGIIDNSYCASGDVWKMPVYATRDTVVEVNDRICQFRLVRNQPRVVFEEVNELTGPARGGFGSTGKA